MLLLKGMIMELSLQKWSSILKYTINSKARVLYATSTTKRSFLDICVKLYRLNNFVILNLLLINFKLQTPEEVSETIPEGYQKGTPFLVVLQARNGFSDSCYGVL